MKITSVEAIPLEAPIERPVGRARQAVQIKARRSLLVRITTDDGLIGYGEGLTPLAPKVPMEIINQVFTPILLGRNPLDTERLWSDLFSTNSSRGYTRGYQMIALSAVDIALWDLKGKILDQPLYNLLGGRFREAVPAYVTGLMLEKDPRFIVDLAVQFRERGFTAMKLKIGDDLKHDLETVHLLRETLGPDVRLMVDANGGYDARTAVRMAKLIEPYDIFWFEEPVPSEDIMGAAEVRSKISMYLAAGECEYNRSDFRNLMINRALDICQPDVSRAGGITEVQKITRLAQAFNVYYAPHAWGGIVCVTASSHLAMATPNCLICELDQVPNPLREELAENPIDFREGVIHVSSEPGLGLRIPEESISRFRIDR